MAKKSEIVKRPSAELAAYEAELASDASADAAKFQQGLARIVHRGGNITVDGNKVPDNKIMVGIIEAVFGKAYYEGDFDPEVAQTPGCYAFHATDQSAMKPHTAAPGKQAEQCTGCPHNKFGTAERGNGKRCKDEIRLICVAPGPDMAGAEVRMMTVPPGSLGGWGKYVSRLRDGGATFRSVLTEVSTEPYKGAYKLTFAPGSKLEPEAYMALKARRASAVEQAMQPYPVLEVDDRPRRGKKSNKKID